MPAALLQAIHRRVAEINRSARDGQFTERRAMLPRHARRPFWEADAGRLRITQSGVTAQPNEQEAEIEELKEVAPFPVDIDP
jgi:hypothetical protein